MMTFSAHQVVVSLKCIGTKAKDNSVLFQGDVTAQKEERSSAGFIPIIGVSQIGIQNALRAASNGAVQEALEKVNDLIVENRDKFK